MFDLLKNKFKSFTDKIFGKAKEKEEEQVVEQPQEVSSPVEQPISEPQPAIQEEPVQITPEIQPIINELTKQADILEGKIPEPEPIPEPVIEEPKPKEHHSIFEIFKPKPKHVEERPLPKVEERPIPKATMEERPVPTIAREPMTTEGSQGTKKSQSDLFSASEIGSKPVEERPVPKPIEERPIPKTETSEDLSIKKSTEIKKSFVTSVKSIFSSKIKLSEKEISDFLSEFELSLLEADVSVTSAENICKDLKEKLTQASFSKENTLEDIKAQIRETLKVQLDIDCAINHYMDKTRKADSPFVIMFIGPNGAGKTTTISKFAYNYKQKGKSVILASGDTFRAGSIDQLEKHADTIGVKIVKQSYGSDPAAVAFDAVTSAKSSKADYVFIDTAGRQENNINLMQELKKIKRVVNPNLTIYIGEAQAGQAIVDQVSGFEKEIGVDGVILTKIDTDPKGGVAISILNELKKPIFFVGTGQTYNDLEEFSPEFIINRIV